ncbi:MAG: Tat pathway signal protein [Candidatus Sumerlaeaceae bacterium]
MTIPMATDKLILANLIHLSYNMWGDWKHPKAGPYWQMQPQLRFDESLWNDLLKTMSKFKMNMVVLDVGDGIQFKSHPEIPVENAWSRDKLKEEMKKMRDMGLEPIPKLNFSACHDAWLKDYARMLSTPAYYKVCKDLIAETIEWFENPRFFHLGMDEEETIHQERFQFVCSRQYDLWWHDFHFLREQVEAAGVRPWIWGDYVWNHAEEFYKNMPKNVLQSNWYRHPVSGPARSVYGAEFNMDIPAATTFIDVDKAGYDQVPTLSNWETPDNISATIQWCEQHCSPDRIKGYLLTPWKPTLESARDRHMDALDHFATAIRDYSVA